MPEILTTFLVAYFALSAISLIWLWWEAKHAPMDYELWPDIYPPPTDD